MDAMNKYYERKEREEREERERKATERLMEIGGENEPPTPPDEPQPIDEAIEELKQMVNSAIKS